MNEIFCFYELVFLFFSLCVGIFLIHLKTRLNQRVFFPKKSSVENGIIYYVKPQKNRFIRSGRLISFSFTGNIIRYGESFNNPKKIIINDDFYNKKFINYIYKFQKGILQQEDL